MRRSAYFAAVAKSNTFSKTLVNWYQKHHRDLPWRHTRDPYLIWLSEIILQQTRVDQGLAYYEKFVRLFPTVGHLAAASEDEVLKAWQGLGYYSRARNLHFSARFVMEHFHGKFPTAFKDVILLKGVGKYTAAAISSFSAGERVAVVDGNVQRVIARVFGITEPVDGTAGQKLIEEKATELIAEADPAAHNQAMMEFGALQCTPQKPDCESCPFAKECVALTSDLVPQLPVKSKKTAVKPLHLYYFVVQQEGNMYLKKRTEGGIWKGLHDFPEVLSEQALSIETAWETFAKTHKLPSAAIVSAPSEVYTHLLSHRKISAQFIPVNVPKTWKAPNSWKAYPTEEDALPGVPRLVEKYLLTAHILNK